MIPPQSWQVHQLACIHFLSLKMDKTTDLYTITTTTIDQNIPTSILMGGSTVKKQLMYNLLWQCLTKQILQPKSEHLTIQGKLTQLENLSQNFIKPSDPIQLPQPYMLAFHLIQSLDFSLTYFKTFWWISSTILFEQKMVSLRNSGA